jgi:hypothetical protein
VLTNQSSTPTTIKVTTREITGYLRFERMLYNSCRELKPKTEWVPWGVTLP